MSETTDPVTGEKDPAALVRVSIVNGLDPTEVPYPLLHYSFTSYL